MRATSEIAVALTMREVRAVLDSEEPGYAAGARLGAEALPFLSTLVASADPLLAAKATYLAGWINLEGSADVLAQAARSHDETVRVAAAGAARQLSSESTDELLLALLDDPDQGVRRLALTAVGPQASDELRARVERLSQADPVPSLRKQALEAMQRAEQGPQHHPAH